MGHPVYQYQEGIGLCLGFEIFFSLLFNFPYALKLQLQAWNIFTKLCSNSKNVASNIIENAGYSNKAYFPGEFFYMYSFIFTKKNSQKYNKNSPVMLIWFHKI